MQMFLRLLMGIWISIFILINKLYANDLSKIDPKFRMLMNEPQLERLYYFQKHGIAKATSSHYINTILKTSTDKKKLKKMGAEIHAVVGDIVTATVPIDRLNDLANLPEIIYIQTPKHLSIHTDVSINEIRAPLVHQNYNVSGSGVIIGIIDTGIDWRHADFRKDDGSTRIKYLLDFSNPGDINGDDKLDGPDAYGGTLYTEQQINNALNGLGTIAEDDVVGHGTHVAGCAAGNGLATGHGFPEKTFLGVAPEADFVIVKATRVQGSMNFVSDDYINALAFVDSIAEVEGKPYVANMSLGSQEGPHDGTSLEEQVIDQLMGTGIPGKAIVISAGNDGDNAIHASGELSSSIASIETRFKIKDYTPISGNYNDYALFEIWYDGAASQTVQLIDPEGTIYGPVVKKNQYSKDTQSGAINIDNASGGRNPLNWDNQAIIQIFDYLESKPPQAGEWKIIISGPSGRFDLWISASSMNVYLTSNIDPSVLIATPGTAKYAITVGSYVTKNGWIDLDGKNVTPVPRPELYTASTFSSPGPSRDGRTKPELCAPGEWIASSYSQYAPPDGEFSMFDTQNDELPNGFICPDGKHALSQGTSMSAPHVTGVIALMLQKYPQLNAAQIKEALIASAKVDKYTLAIPNNKWGFGKLDAFTAMQYVSGQKVEQKFSVSIFQNPALTQYIDFYLLAKYPLKSVPTATIKIGDTTRTIDMEEIESQMYKGEYQFSIDGTAMLTIKATIQGEPETTLIEYFGVKFLKPEFGGIVAFNEMNLFISKNSFSDNTYFTAFPVKEIINADKLYAVSKTYQIGPADFSFKQAVSLSFCYDDNISTKLDESRLRIFALEYGSWKKLNSVVDTDRNIVTTSINRLGTFMLCYDPSADIGSDMPTSFMLYQNFPNPFNAHTTVAYQLPYDTKIAIKVYNIRGEFVTTLFNGIQTAGIHKVIWDGTDKHNSQVASGIYLCRLLSDNYSFSQKMLWIK